MKKLVTTTAISLLLAGSVSAGGPFSTEADALSDPRDQAAGEQATDTQVDSSRPEAGEDASGRGGQGYKGAENAEFEDE